jgi:hypothetical protein
MNMKSHAIKMPCLLLDINFMLLVILIKTK